MKIIDVECHKLPKKLSTSGKKLQDIIDEATEILISDFSKGEVFFRGKKVVGEYPYTKKASYLHILKLDDETATNRLLVERALRSNQYAPLLKLGSKSNCCHLFKYWKEFDMKKSRWTHKVLCEKNKILIILGQMKDSFILVTAYHLMGNGLKKQLKRYENSKNKL